ncbi:MAG TPA: hypothetical protein VI685_01145 [Candidatus Angelobacter sp.]
MMTTDLADPRHAVFTDEKQVDSAILRILLRIKAKPVAEPVAEAFFVAESCDRDAGCVTHAG